MKHTLVFAIALSLTLSACANDVQTTSGADYLSQYQSLPVKPSTTSVMTSNGLTTTKEVQSFDQRLREVAAVEPILKFPARIGLARIDDGRLTNIPIEEANGWHETDEKLGKNFGEFVPLNLMVTSMVAGSTGYSQNVGNTIDAIRLGAARQHLDAVLVYEVISKDSTHSNLLTIANASIIGGYILPSKQQDAEGLASGILIDVMQGYPYGTIRTVVEKKTRVSSSWGWGSEQTDKTAFSDKVKSQAATQLSAEAYDMFIKLRAELAEKKH